ncbi:B12-binding domain-containing radical SAM protein [bacterium]|nr:B12-binding domain-containing radical SAM protein [bacterium]
MHLTLISPYSDITSLGVRSLAATMKSNGFAVRLVFIPENRPELSTLGDSWGADEAAIIDQCSELLRDTDLVGISLMSNYRVRAVTLTEGLRRKIRSDTLIIWGGIHPTIRPEQCLDYADAVCLGEGEHALLDFVQVMHQGRDYHQVANFCFRQGNSTIRNPVRPLIRELDTLPFPDYTLNDDHIFSFEQGRFQKMDQDLLAVHMLRGYISGIRNRIAYQTIATRGCPHNCTYCCNNSLRELYGGKNYLRRRSNTHIVAELETICSRYPFIQEIGFSDDSFFAANIHEINDFATLYREKVHLPFFCLGSPTTITPEKMEALTGSGLYGIQMGIQTGSERTQRLYQRKIRNEKIISAARILHSFQEDMIPPTYDIIIDNPYERPEDFHDTFRLLLELPRPHHIQVFSLVLFPETELYKQAIRDRFLAEAGELEPIKEYHHRRGTYINLVFALFARNAPLFLLRILTLRCVVMFMSRPGPTRIFESLYGCYKKRKRTNRSG